MHVHATLVDARAVPERLADHDELIDLEHAFQKDAAELGSVPEPEALGLLDVPVKPRKSDTVVERVALVWVP